MARKKNEGGAEAGARLSPVDVQQVQFRRALRGYEEQEVDDFLDRVTEELTRLLDERRALTERAGQLPTIRVQSAGDAAAVSRQAEELVAQARERAESIVREAQQRAAEIVRDAEARAAGGRAPAAPATGSGPGVAGFVTKEREFLQQLASLVQGHAQTVREMVASARESGAAAPGGAGAPQAAAPSAGSSPGPGTGSSSAGAAASSRAPSTGGSVGGAGVAPPSGSGGSGEGGARPGQQQSGPSTPAAGDRDSEGSGSSTAQAQVRVPDLAGSAQRSEPVAGSAPMSRRIEVAGPPQPKPPSGTPSAAGGDDASLRELFWGED